LLVDDRIKYLKLGKKLAKISHPKSIDLKGGANNEKPLENIVKINIK
jgi:hypothetical protein